MDHGGCSEEPCVASSILALGTDQISSVFRSARPGRKAEYRCQPTSAYPQQVISETPAIGRPITAAVTVRPPVGVAKAEARLTRVALAQPYALVRPGRGYGLMALDEVELGIGRPDVVMLSLSGAA